MPFSSPGCLKAVTSLHLESGFADEVHRGSFQIASHVFVSKHMLHDGRITLVRHPIELLATIIQSPSEPCVVFFLSQHAERLHGFFAGVALRKPRKVHKIRGPCRPLVYRALIARTPRKDHQTLEAAMICPSVPKVCHGFRQESLPTILFAV